MYYIMDNIYLNLSYNPVENAGQFTSQAKINQTMTQAILDNPSEYFGSIIRFRIPTDAIPMYFWRLDVGQNNPNVSLLSIGINVGGTKASTKLVYVPDVIGTNPVPVPAGSAPFFTIAQATSDYYAIYNIDNLIRAFNVAIDTSMTTLALAEPRPYFIYEPATELISCIVTTAFISAGLTMFMNNDCVSFLDGFPKIKNNSPSSAADIWYFKFDIPPYLGVSPYKFQSEYSNMSLWFDVTKIIITSNGLPIRNEQAPFENTGVSNAIPIFTDYEVAFDNVSMTNGIAIYNPQSQYRLVDLTSNSPIYKIDLGFLYQDKFGTIRPIYISADQSISVKIAFFKKSLYKNTL
jgi:hypothetical protein